MNLRAAVAGALLAVVSVSSYASIPANLSLGRVSPTPSGIVNTKYRDGNDGTVAVPLIWGTCPTITLTDGGACTTNLRTACNLVEAGSPTSTLSLLSGTLPSGCSVSGDGLAGTVGAVASAQVVIRATRNSDTADTAAFTVQSLASGTDTAAPTVPLALAGVDNTDGTATLTWEASGDPNVGGTVTGVASYQVKLAGSPVATVTAPNANIQPALTATEIGSDTGESSSQAGADWTLTYSGTGLGSTADNIYGRMALVSGDYTATLKVTSYTPVSGTAGSAGIAARASNSATGAISIYSRWRDTDDKCNQRYRISLGGAASNGTLSTLTYTAPWIKQTRAGDTFSTYCSSDSGQTWALTSSQTVSPGASVYLGPFVTSGSTGNAATAVVSDFAVIQGVGGSYTYTGAGGSFTVNAYDGANRSGDSAATTVTPTGGASAALVTVPAATHTVCNSGCTYTPSQLATVAISTRSAGDSLELRTATAGGTEEWPARIYCNGVSGTSVAPIWVAVRDGDQIVFDAPTAADVGLIDLTDCDYWNFVGSRDGTAADFKLGDETWHTAQCAQFETAANFGCYPNARTIMVRSSTGVAFVGMTLRGANDHDATLIDSASARALLKYIEWGYDGHNAYDTNKNGTIDNSGDTDTKDIGHVCASTSVLEDIYAHHAGHVPPLPCGPYQVWRRFSGDGNWLDRTTTPRFTGNHSGVFLPGGNRPDYNTTTRFGPLIENSLFYNPGSEPEHRNFQETTQLFGVNLIVRGNYIVQRAGTNPDLGVISPQFVNSCATNTPNQGATVRASNLQLYNNTLWGGFVANTSGSLGGAITGLPADSCARYIVKNNLFQGQQTGTKSGGSQSYTVSFTAPGDFTGYSNAWKSAEWMGNIFGAHPTDPPLAAFYKVALNTAGTGGSGGGSQNLNAAIDANADHDCTDGEDTAGLWPSNWCGNIVAALTWAGGTTTPVSNSYNDTSIDRTTLRGLLALSPSAAYGIGDAWPMTYVATADGGSGTTLVLDNARWIYDGWDIDEYTWGGLHTEYPDCIAVGPTTTSTAAQAVVVQVATASDINYTTNTVTLAAGVSRQDGSPVWPATRNADGTCGAVWDNRGAAQ